MSRIDPAEKAAIREKVIEAVNQAQITDVHTHVCPEAFGELLLWGIDELITYHYLIAETLRWGVISPETFWQLSKRAQADVIWKTLFIDHSPYSESCRGILTALDSFGLDVSSRDLPQYRRFFESRKLADHIDDVFKLSGVSSVVMTNDPFDDLERPAWLELGNSDSRFHAALRIDKILVFWKDAVPRLKQWGYNVTRNPNERTYSEVRRFLSEWVERMGALYMAVSLTPDFVLPDDSVRSSLIENCVLPVCRETNIPFAMMIGVRRQANPELRVAGDAVGKGDVRAVNYLCANYPDNKFMVTMLARENQHELCVSARKFANLMIFGCWWFLNNPSLVDEITRMRLELLGASVIPQHSDARVLDQLVYKWSHSRGVIGEALADKFADLAETGWIPTDQEINRDVADLLGGNFWSFLKR